MYLYLVAARLIKQSVKQSIMSIRTSKSKIYCTIHRQVQFLTVHSTKKVICHIGANQLFQTSASQGIALRHTLVGTQFYDTPRSGRIFMACPGRKTVNRHSLVATQYYNMTGRDTLLQHVLVGTQLFNMSWSGCSFAICPGWKAVLRSPVTGRG